VGVEWAKGRWSLVKPRHCACITAVLDASFDGLQRPFAVFQCCSDGTQLPRGLGVGSPSEAVHRPRTGQRAADRPVGNNVPPSRASWIPLVRAGAAPGCDGGWRLAAGRPDIGISAASEIQINQLTEISICLYSIHSRAVPCEPTILHHNNTKSNRPGMLRHERSLWWRELVTATATRRNSYRVSHSLSSSHCYQYSPPHHHSHSTCIHNTNNQHTSP
jgi:hypothetical protein